MTADPEVPDRGPLDADQRRELAEAGERARTFLPAAKTAAFNGWTIGTFAAVTILFGVTSPTALALGVGMAVVARNELRGRTLIRSFDPAGPRLLVKNQLGLGALIVVYCLWSLYRTTRGGGSELDELEAVMPGTEALVRSLTVTVYVAVIAATLVFQGLLARYYRVRQQRVESYLRDTPAWIVDLQRSAATE